MVVLHARKAQRRWELDLAILDKHGLEGLHDGIVIGRWGSTLTLAHGIGGHQFELRSELSVAVVDALKGLGGHTGVQTEVEHVTLLSLLQLLGQLFRLGLAPFQDDVNVLVGNSGVLRAEDGIGTESDRCHDLIGRYLVLILEPSLLDNHGVQLELLLGTFDDLLLDGILGDKTENANRLRLADAMGSILRL